MPYLSEDGFYEIPCATDTYPQLFLICAKCGVCIDPKNLERHTKFHEDYEELVDWARSVSQLFGPRTNPSPSASGNDAENVGQLERGIKDVFETGSSEEGLQKGSE